MAEAQKEIGGAHKVMYNKKKKWSRPAKLTLLAGCLVLAAGGYVLTTKLVASAEQKEAEASQISFTAVDADDLTALSWTYDGETYALQKDADGDWQWPEDTKFPVDQTTISYMEYALSDITATRALENVTDLSQYGLDDPQSVITYTTADGTKVEILTGDHNDIASEYYAQLAGENTVYLVSGDYMEDFQYAIDDLLAVESLPIYEEDTELRATADGKTTVYDLTADDGDETDEADAASTAQEIADGMRGLNFETCVNYKAGKKDLASYGLADPQMSFTIKGKQTADDGTSTTAQFTLQAGSKTGSSYYVRLKDSKMVYTVSADEIEALRG